MGLTLLIIFLCCLLKSYSLIITPTQKPTVDFNRVTSLDSIQELKLFDCIEDEDCTWMKNSSCISMKCVCKKKFINIYNQCFERRYLGDHCLYSQQCSNYKSDCINNICSCKPKYKNVDNVSCMLDFSEICQDDCSWLENGHCDIYIAKGCVCNDNYIHINGKCHEKGYLNDSCLYSAQCRPYNSLCLKNKCSCKSGYHNVGNSYCTLDNPGDSDCVIRGCTQGSYCDHSIRKCVCKDNYVRIGDRCLIKAILGQYCTDFRQCQADNSVCIRNKCICRSGYKSSAFSCFKPIQEPKIDSFVIILSSLSVIIVGVVIIVSVFVIRKKILAARSRTEINTIHFPSESNISNRGQEAQHQTIGSGCSIAEITVSLDIEKPPSYEEVMRSSTYNLTNHEASHRGQSNPGFVR